MSRFDKFLIRCFLIATIVSCVTMHFRLAAIEENQGALFFMQAQQSTTLYVSLDMQSRLYHYAAHHTHVMTGCPECFDLRDKYRKQEKAREAGEGDEEMKKLRMTAR